MFLRELKVRKDQKEYTYLKVVESVREKGRNVQRTLVNLGNVSQWPAEKIVELVGLLTKFLRMDLILLAQVKLVKCRQLGPYLVLARLWDRLGLDGIITHALSGRKMDPRVLDCVKAMVFTRLMEPKSKKATWELVAQEIEIPGVDGVSLSLQSYYRSLTYLSETKREIEKAMHQRMAHLFNQDISLVFYDLTSAYFEGEQCSMAKHGYSREHRPDLLQIEIGLLVDAEGLPIGHEVFDGNVKDVATVLDTLKRLKEDFGVRRCVFIGDDGMASEANLAEVERQGYEYITSLALRRSLVGRELIKSALPKSAWTRISDNLWLCPLGAEGSIRYIGSYNPERAASSRRHRRKHLRDCVTYLRGLQTGPKPRGRKRSPDEILTAADRFLRKKGCRGFIRLELATIDPDGKSSLRWKLDRSALRHERKMDGLLVLKTNSTTLSDQEVASGYRTLWRVEDAFRHMKSGIQLRPIRHWSDPRVLGHVFVCVLAYALERLYERELEKAGVPMTARAALDKLRPVVVGTLEAGGQQLRRRSNIDPIQSRLLAAAGVTKVPELW